jgi:hypothetical protein
MQSINRSCVNEQRQSGIPNILKTAFFRVVTQRVVVIPYRSFGEYRSVYCLDALMMELIGCPETSVRNNHYSLRNNPEEGSSQLLRGGSQKSPTPNALLNWAAHLCSTLGESSDSRLNPVALLLILLSLCYNMEVQILNLGQDHFLTQLLKFTIP